jgi:hypothetical protein
MLFALLALTFGLVGSPDFSFDEPIEKRFRDVTIQPTFKKMLTSNLLLMEITGAKVISLPNNRKAVIGVASTAIKKDSSADRLRAEKVCRIKALASIVAEKKGIQVVQYEELKDETRIVIDGDEERITSVETLLKFTKTKVEGVAKDMPVVGRWSSADGDIFYLAIGMIFDENGQALPCKNEIEQ